ncbi:MAG: hypothetical protein CVV27_03860 [Candidatus Melainabacteria bacterium HGW-Melainabacteria-1]|nr:MAG: hypothetical protein CVV27_03860 [Candidatus Melainabacteria bacterium HGW-Melainabacteria-1]
MRKPVDNKAKLLKNKGKFGQIFRRKVAKQDVPVLNYAGIQKLLNSSRQVLGVTQAMSFRELIKQLVELGLLKEYRFQFPHDSFTRYAPPDVLLYSVVATFYKDAYFSHFSAMYLHQLTDQLPKTIFLNFEQSPKPVSASWRTLEQANIDLAFSRKQRVTNNRCVFEEQTIVILNGKSTGCEGVEKISLNDREAVRVSDLERTLIDIAVRPSYAGGIQQVLSAYERAKDLGVSVNRLAATLKRLNYIYPYHQAIGFYLERAGYSESQLALLERLDKEHDFYLDYELRDPDYSKRWRLYIPKGF